MDNNNLTPEELEQLQREQEQAQMQTGPSFSDRISQARGTYNDINKIREKVEASKAKNSVNAANQAAGGTSGGVGTGTSAATSSGAATSTTAASSAGSTAGGAAASSASGVTGATTTGAGVGSTTATASATGATTAAGSAAATSSATASATAAGASAGTATGAAAGGVSLFAVLGWILLIILAIALIGVLVATIYYSVIDPLSTKYSVDPETIVNEYDDNKTPDDAEGVTDSDVGGIRNILNTDDMDLDELFANESSNKLGFVESFKSLMYEWFSWLPGSTSNLSTSLINRIIEINLEDKLKEMNTTDREALPLGALLTTFTYTYASQYLDSERNEYVDTVECESGSDCITNRVNPTQPLAMIASLFKEEILTLKNPDDIGDLLDAMVFHEFYPTYKWGTTPRSYCNHVDKVCYEYIGCNQSSTDSYKLDYNKFYVYLRYGAYVSGYAVDSSNKYEKVRDGKTEELWGIERKKALDGTENIKNYKEDSSHVIAFGYEYYYNLNSAFNTSKNDNYSCILYANANEKFISEYKGRSCEASEGYTCEYVFDSGSVEKANNFFKERDVADGNSIINYNHEIFDGFTKYTAKANPDTDTADNATVKIDNSKPSADASFVVNAGNGETYTYKHGWIYNRFPHFRDEFQKNEGEIYEFDDVLTPKLIESQIEDIDSYKDIFNDVLGYESGYFANNTWSSSFNSTGTESFPLPIGQFVIKSCVGERTINGKFSNHGGIDIAASIGTPIYAWKGGTVVRTNDGCPYGYYGSSCGGGYGNYVVIDHGNNTYSVYAHMTSGSVSVSVGDEVGVGQQIGSIGSSGSSTGPHLHFEIRTGGSSWTTATRQDPYPTLAEIVGGDLPSVCTEDTILNITSTTLKPSTGADGTLAGEVLSLASQYVGMDYKEFNSSTGVKTSTPWCARFVSYILEQTGVYPNYITKTSASTETFYSYFNNNDDGVVWNSRTSSYTPKPGDIIMFNYETGRTVSHIGIVESVNGDTITYIDGNTSKTCNPGVSSVCRNTVSRNRNSVVGFASWY